MPGGFCIAFIFSFYVSLSNNSSLCDYISASKAYKAIEAGAVRPIMNSDAVQAIPPLIDNTVNRVVNCLSPEGRRLLIRVYINGMTVEDAVVSNHDIDNVAIDLVDTETNDYKKAEILYDWICAQISYNKEKAEAVAVDAFTVTSGSVTAFAEKTGICFDKACLFVSMCRAVDVPVRLVTGQGFNGSLWEDHSWNQIYDSESGRWVNVDTTFGSSGGDYFDRDGFYDDHRYEDVQGEWLD
jgi:transglutaminase-like putative cysteine protease